MSRDDVPAFLLDSPFLPMSRDDGPYYNPRKRPKPTRFQILSFKTRRLRPCLVVLLILYLLVLLKRLIFRSALYIQTPTCLRHDLIEPSFGYNPHDVDWTQFAYAQYATDAEYLCNSVMLFDTLWEKESRAEKVLMYPDHWSLEATGGVQTRLLKKARDDYGVILKPVRVVSNHKQKDDWSTSYTKLLSFNLTSYKRILHLDSDGLLFRHMDELFLLPDSTGPIVVPRAYWLAQPTLASHIMLLSPSFETFSTITSTIAAQAGRRIHDMEIVNLLFSSSCSVIPHRTYALLTGEFRRARKKHQSFLSKRGDGLGGSMWGDGWDPDRAGRFDRDAAWVHFSDYPLGKPWESEGSKGLFAKMMPGCFDAKGRLIKGTEGVAVLDEREDDWDCRERDIWTGWYEEFWGRRERICGAE